MSTRFAPILLVGVFALAACNRSPDTSTTTTTTTVTPSSQKGTPDPAPSSTAAPSAAGAADPHPKGLAALLASASASATPSASAPARPKSLVAGPTVDRISRNRDRDPPCPAGFTEEPGAEQHSTCARNCKSDADCHHHTCEDSEVSDGKVCSTTAAP